MSLYATYVNLKMQSEETRIAHALLEAGLCFMYDSSEVTTTTVKMGRKASSPVRVSHDASKRIVPCKVLEVSRRYATLMPLCVVTKKLDALPPGAYEVFDGLTPKTHKHKTRPVIITSETREDGTEVYYEKALQYDSFTRLAVRKNMLPVHATSEYLKPVNYDECFFHLVGREPEPWERADL